MFAFLDLEHPAVAWAVVRGRLVSAAFAPSRPEAFISFMLAGIIQHENNSRLINELLIESVRSSQFTEKRSRLRCMYFFPSREAAITRVGDQHWPPYFNVENLVELEIQKGYFTVADANWITFAPRQANGILATDRTWIEKYWSGIAYGASPVWELLVEGIATVVDERARRKCTELLVRRFPDSHIALHMARIAGEVGSNGGLVNPFLQNLDDDSIQLVYLWRDAEFHDKQVIAEMGQHPDFGGLQALMAKSKNWTMPDLRPWFRRFEVRTKEFSAGTRDPRVSVHLV